MHSWINRTISENHILIVKSSADNDIIILVNEIDKILRDDVKIMGKKNIHGVKNILEDIPSREENYDSRMISIDLILRKVLI